MNTKKLTRLCITCALFGFGVAAGAKADNTTTKATHHSSITSYVRADAGYSMPASKLSSKYGKKLDESVMGSFGLGLHLDKAVRSDLTVSYRGQYKYSDTIKYPLGGKELTMKGKQKVESFAVMANGYLEVLPFITEHTAGFGWHLMAGAGVAFNKTDNFAGPSIYMLGTTVRDFAWNVGTGITYEVLKGMHVSLAYKYADLGKIENLDASPTNPFKGRVNGRLKTHEATFGIMYNL